MTTELHPDEPLDEGYWESLGDEVDARQQSPYNRPPPGADQDPFSTQAEDKIGGRGYEPQWLTTYGGIEFIDVFVGELPDSDETHALIFLVEFEGLWNVGICQPKTTNGGRFLVEDVDYDTAKRTAERAARGMSVDRGRNAEWRDGYPSPGQLRLIKKLGLGAAEEITNKGQASDLLNIYFDSKTLDPDFGGQ